MARTMKAQTLPCCGALTSSQTQLVQRQSQKRDPQEGDLSICGDCGHWLRFGKGMVLRKFTADDFVECNDDELAVMRRASAAFRLHKRSMR